SRGFMKPRLFSDVFKAQRRVRRSGRTIAIGALTLAASSSAAVVDHPPPFNTEPFGIIEDLEADTAAVNDQREPPTNGGSLGLPGDEADAGLLTPQAAESDAERFPTFDRTAQQTARANITSLTSPGTQLAEAEPEPEPLSSAGAAPLPLVEPPAVSGAETGQIRAPQAEPYRINDQLHPEQPAGGVMVGGFRMQHEETAAVGYDSDDFPTPNGRRSDFLAAVAASAPVQSVGPSDACGLKAKGEFRQYATQTTENVNNASVAADSRIDLAPNAYILAGGSYQLLHEDRGALVAVN